MVSFLILRRCQSGKLLFWDNMQELRRRGHVTDHKEIPDRDEVLLVLKAMYALAQKGWRFESDSLGMHVYAINGTTRLVASGPKWLGSI
jgi:hypothetical protein